MLEKCVSSSCLRSAVGVCRHGNGNPVSQRQIGAIGKVAVVQSSVSLAHTGSIFANFTGTVTVQYEVRTALSTGSSSLTLKAASEFSPSNGPNR